MAPRVTPRGVLPRAAIRYLRSKHRRPSAHWRAVWREEHATAFTVAQMTQDDLLAETHRAVTRALAKGETLETFRDALGPWLQHRGWAPTGRAGTVPTRLRRIYRVNLRTARAAGQWDRITRTADLLPYLVYELGPSETHRPEHAAWAGLCLPVDDPWWNTHYPPNGWGCRCRVRQVARPPTGARTRAPPVRRVPETPGSRRRVTPGIDPGWDFHPGAHRTLGIHRRLLGQLEDTLAGRRFAGVAAAARVRRVRARLQQYVTGPGFRWFVERPRATRAPTWDTSRLEDVEAVPLAVLPAATAARLGTTSRLLRLTEPVADKQWRRHGPGRHRLDRGREVPVAWYADLQTILNGVDVPTPGQGGRWVFERRGRRVVVGVDPAGRPVVISYHGRDAGPARADPAPR